MQTDDSILSSCPEITTMNDAMAPIVSPLLPVVGLRHDENGNLTNDAIQTIMDGIKSMGMDINSEDIKTTILDEAKKSLCTIHSQYVFLLKSYTRTSNKDMYDQLFAKAQAMKDILSVVRHIIDLKEPDGSMVEGFLGNYTGNSKVALKEAFESVQNKVQNYEMLMAGVTDFQSETLLISEEKNRSVDAYLSLYGFMNVVAIGLLFYITTLP